MVDYARRSNGEIVYANDFNDDEWKHYKENYVLGELLMPCCSSPAIPKTSPNFLKFFAHYTDECSTSPESEWHLRAKEDLARHLGERGLTPLLEHSGNNAKGSWRADIYFEFNGKKFALEVQHSYQTLEQYINRQNRYNESSVSCFWIIYKPRYLTLTKSIAKFKIKTEFGGKLPAGGLIPILSNMPAFYLGKVRTSS